MASAFREFFRIPRQHRIVTGIDLGTHAVKVVSLERTKGDAPKLVYAAKEIVPPGDPDDLPSRQADALKHALGRRRGRLGWVVGAFPRSMTSARIISLPTIQPAEVAEMVRFDAERHIPFQADEAEISHQILAQHENYTSDVLLVSARRGNLERYLQAFQDAGVEVDYVAVSAVGNCWPFALRDVDGRTVAVLDIGHRSTDLSIFRNRKIHFSRTIMVGTQRLEQYLADEGRPPDTVGDAAGWDFSRNGAFETTAEQRWLSELLPELRRSLQAFRHEPQGSDVDQVIICGGLAHAAGLEGKLFEEIGIDTEAARDVIPPEVKRGKIESLEPEMATAVGVALDVFHSGERSANLLPHGIVDARRREHTRGFVRQVATFLVMAALLAGGVLYNNYNLLEKKIAFFEVANDELAPRIAEAQKMKIELEILDSLRDQDVTAYRVLENIYAITPDDIQIEDLQFGKALDERDSDEVQMTGKAHSNQAALAYAETMLKSPYVDEVSPGQIYQISEYGVPLVRFNLTVVLARSPGAAKPEPSRTASRGK